MDGAESEVDEVKPSETSKTNDNRIFCGAQKLRNFFTKLRRNSIAGEEETTTSSYVVERKLSSGFCYKLKDEKSAVKTLWPVACREFLFLPEFKVHNERLEDKFQVITYVAKGSFGTVYKVRKTSDSPVFALKVLEKSKIILDDYVQQLKYEVLIQQAISHHPFIATSFERWQNKGCVYQLTEFVSQGEILLKIKSFSQKLVQFYVAQLAIVIDFLHNAGIIYRDLKSENILLDEQFHIKLTDFGLSKWLKAGQRTFTICGTHSSMAPEIFTGEGYSHAVDWYALGVLASRMMNGDQHKCEDEFKDFDQVDDAPRCAADEIEMKGINDAGGMLQKSDLDDASKDLLRRLLETNPSHRLKSLLALERIAFFHNYNLDDVRHMKKMSCNSTAEHSFFGYWEIIESWDSSLSENLGLNGIKFLLDESGDIIWFNDLFSIQVVAVNDDQQSSPTIWLSKSMADDEKSKYTTGNESADIFFSCETFEVINMDIDMTNELGLLFRSFAGHHIEFRIGSVNPLEQMSLNCEGWCNLTCKRIKKDQSTGQSIQYTLLSAFEEKFFSDVTIKSCDGFSFEVHSPILRLNGFDCSSLNQSPMSSTISSIQPTQPISNFLSPPTIHLSTFNFSPNFVNHISNSFNCLTSSRDSIYHLTAPLGNSKTGQISSSDSHLNSLHDDTKDNVFNFPPIQVTPTQTVQKKNEQRHKLRLSSSQIIFKNPLSPFRVRSSPLPFLNLSLDTPLTPSSPLTSVSVLFSITKDTLMPVLHWLYSESLPQHLSETQLEDLLKLCATIPALSKMLSPCKKYLRLIKLKKVIIDIFMEVHGCLNRMILMLNPYNLARCPSSLCEIFKQCLCEISVGLTLFLQLSQIFSKDTFLNRFQRNEIIKFIKSRVPIFISQLLQLLQNVLAIMKSLQQEEKDDLVIYLVPEIILALDVTTELLDDLKKSFEAICKNIQGEQDDSDVKREKNSASAVDKDLKFFLHVCEVKKLHDIYSKVNSIAEVIQHKQFTFKSMNLAEKQSCISINMDHVLIEIPIVIERLEDLSKDMDDKFGWKEFKFCFKFATSHINGILSKLLEHKATLLYPILELCQLVNKSAFTNKLVQLGLLERNVAAKHFDASDSDNVDSEQKLIKDYNSYKINLFSGLCESPNAINSNLSKNALKLLHSGHLSDMEFEVITTATVSDDTVSLTTTSVAIIAPSSHNVYDYNDGTAKKEYHIFKAHRVIVAARCEYLRKALLSGMQEDINRKITIYDTSPVIFRRFLLYLYGAPVDKNVGLESICELMLLADRYSVDSLKEVCEQTLMSMIDCESVICMLGISDRFNANTLKASCLSFLSQHIELTASEIFRELSQDLQAEVFELIQWRKRCTTDAWSHLSSRYDDPLRSRHSLKSPSRPSKSRSRKSSPSYHK